MYLKIKDAVFIKDKNTFGIVRTFTSNTVDIEEDTGTYTYQHNQTSGFIRVDAINNRKIDWNQPIQIFINEEWEEFIPLSKPHMEEIWGKIGLVNNIFRLSKILLRNVLRIQGYTYYYKDKKDIIRAMFVPEDTDASKREYKISPEPNEFLGVIRTNFKEGTDDFPDFL